MALPQTRSVCLEFLSLQKRYDWQQAAIRQITNPCAHIYGEDLHKLDIFHAVSTGHFLKASSSKGNSLVLIPQESNWRAVSDAKSPFIAGITLSLTISSSTAWLLFQSTFNKAWHKETSFPVKKLLNTPSLKSTIIKHPAGV